MQRKVVFAILALVLVLGAFGALVLTACGSEGDTGARDESAAPSAAATGEPLKIGFDEGFTGFMAVDADLTDKGIELAIEQLGGQIDGRPLEYIKADNGSDPVQAVDKARQLVESDKIDVMLGPIFSPANAAVTDYLAKNGGIPSISIYGQPIDNMKTANGLSFVPSGLFSFAGYLTGKYAAEEMGYKTANCINYEDTAGRQLQEGFNNGFEEGRRQDPQHAVRADRRRRLQLLPHQPQGRRLHLLVDLRQRRRAVRQAVQGLRPHGSAHHRDGEQPHRAAAGRPR